MLGLGSSLASGFIESKYSAVFDGTDDYINVDNLAKLLSDDMAFSVSIWFKGGSNTGPTGNILFSAHDTSYGNVIRIGVDAGSSPGIFYSDTSTSNHDGLGSTDLDDGDWHHIILTRPAGAGDQQAKLYIDGGNAWTTHLNDVDPSWTSATRVTIGQEYDGAPPGGVSDLFQGNIGDVAFWNAELDDASRKEVYNNGKPFDLTFDQGNYDNAKDLIGYWRPGYGLFDDIVNGIIHDQSNAPVGDEIVTNGTFASDASNWTAGSDSSLSVSGGHLVVSIPSDDNYGNAYQQISLEQGHDYLLSAELVSATGSSEVKIDTSAAGTSTTLVTILSNTVGYGTHKAIFTANYSGSAYLQLRCFHTPSEAAEAQFDNISVKKINKPGFSSELLLVPEFSNSGDLDTTTLATLGYNLQVSGSGATTAAVQNGELTINVSTPDGNAGRVFMQVIDGVTLKADNMYKATYTVVSTSNFDGSDHFSIWDGNSYETVPHAVGTHVVYFTWTGSDRTSLPMQLAGQNSGAAGIVLSKMSLVKLNSIPGVTHGGVTFSSDTP